MTEGAANTRKWWLEATYVTAVSVAIIVPGVTLLDHWLDYKLEVAKQEHALHLDEQKQSHQIRQTYLDRAIDPHKTTEYRRSVLTFLTETLDDKEPMKKWAKEELQRLEIALELETKLAAAEAQSKKLRQELSQARASAGKSKDDVHKLVQSLKAAEAEVGSLQKELESAKNKANIAPATQLPSENPNDSRNEGTNNDKSNSQGGVKQALRRGGFCCVTCNGTLVCGATVTTLCGSCQGGAGAN